MISHLKGTVESTSENTLVIDVNGVGYSVLCSSRTISAANGASGIVHIYTVLNVREDAWIMYGFISEKERFWFQTLTSVQGVGGKVAIAILSALSDDDIYSAFLANDKTAFTRADGVGPKLAARIISELKDKVVGKISNTDIKISVPSSEISIVNDVISALINLGYQKADIYRIISSMKITNEDKFENILRSVLNKLSAGT